MSRKSKKIISLRGSAIPQREPQPEVIETLQRLLAEAESGNIVGLLYGVVDPFGHISTEFTGKAQAHSMVAAAALIYHRIVAAFGGF